MARVTIEERTLIFHYLLEGCINGKPMKGKMQFLAAKYGCHWGSISRVWEQARKMKAQGVPVIFKNTKKEAVRPKKHFPDLQLITLVPFEKRQCIRGLVEHIPPSKSTIGRWIALVLLKVRTIAMKLVLTAECRLIRLKFILRVIHSVTPGGVLLFKRMCGVLLFKSMCNTVHLDEKWFSQATRSMRIIHMPDEEEPFRNGNKKHIPKISYVCVFAKPIISVTNEVLFDGKTGVWAFTERVQTVRRSRNRGANVWIIKPLQYITRKVFKTVLNDEVSPVLKVKWPHLLLGKHVIIQQGNAPTHVRDDDPDFRAAASIDGWDIRLVCQPANSPDLNVNDLGWFNSLQSLQQRLE